MMLTGKWRGAGRVQHGAARSGSVPRGRSRTAACPGRSSSTRRPAVTANRVVHEPPATRRSTSMCRGVETPCLRRRPGRAAAQPRASWPTSRRGPAARSCSRSRASRSGRRSRWSALPRRASRRARSPRRGSAREEMGGEVHAYAPAYSDSRAREILDARRPRRLQLVLAVASGSADRVRARPASRSVRPAGQPGAPEVEVALYDPAAPGSRLGVDPRPSSAAELWTASTGLHFHTLCELGRRRARAHAGRVRARSSATFIARRRVGQLRRRPPHHAARLRRRPAWSTWCAASATATASRSTSSRARRSRSAPACWWRACSTLVDNGIDIAILDTSATAHMPDVLEMPYRAGHRRRRRAGRAPRTPTGWAGRPAWPATSSATTRSPRRSRSATSWCSATWPTTRWSRPPPSTGCACPRSRSTIRRPVDPRRAPVRLPGLQEPPVLSRLSRAGCASGPRRPPPGRPRLFRKTTARRRPTGSGRGG